MFQVANTASATCNISICVPPHCHTFHMKAKISEGGVLHQSLLNECDQHDNGYSVGSDCRTEREHNLKTR